MNVLLDLDGTLTNPREGIVACFRHALTAMKCPLPTDAELARFIGPPLRDALQEILRTNDAERIEQAVTVYRARFASLGIFENEVYQGIPAGLRLLASRGAKLLLATSKPRVYAERILDHFGLMRHFAGVYGSELDGSRSDKRELIRHILTAERLRADDTVMVGDRFHDIRGAVHNGVLPIGVLWGFGSREELTSAGAVRLLESTVEIGSISDGSGAQGA